MLQFMQEVDNGYVTGVAYDHELDEADRKIIEEAAYDAEEFLEASEREHPHHDYVQEDFSNPQVDVDAVKIDSDLGIVDVISNGNLSERYTILGVLEDDGVDVYMGQEVGGTTQVIKQSDNSIDWNPEKAAAYEAIEGYVDFDPGEMEDPEVVEGLTNRSVKGEEHSRANARGAVKQADRVLARTSDPRISGLADFEEIGEVRVDNKDHPFSKRTKGARGVHAAREIGNLVDDLYRMHLIDYQTDSLNGNMDRDEATLQIDDQFLEEGVRDDVAAVNDHGDEVDEFVEELVDERYPW